MANALEVNRLTKRYKDFKLDEVSFVLPKGSIMGFIGENGAGKTTTIKAILNLVKTDSGSVQILGMDNKKNEKQIKQEIGVVFDGSNFHDALKAKDISKIMKGIYANWDDSLFNEYLRKLKIPIAKTVKEYSRGMKMKLAIAAALSHHPRLLLLDEATGGLDPIMRNEVLDILLDFIQDEEKAVFFSSHIIGDLEKIADYITFIHEGKIIFMESKDDLIYNYGIMKCGADDFIKIDPNDIVGYQKNHFGCEILVRDKSKMAHKYPDFLIDQTNIEEIMLYYVKGEKR
ncbi:MAG: ABC transporter ATP-binding protein [Clostridia bacterium]|jgi:ABC-2 type transport system ATP-binding protein|nr:ABC transporter ATP-binding protein [Clostridia bacterium]